MPPTRLLAILPQLDAAWLRWTLLALAEVVAVVGVAELILASKSTAAVSRASWQVVNTSSPGPTAVTEAEPRAAAQSSAATCAL